MLTRRTFLFTAAVPISAAPSLTSRERVNRVLEGKEPDRQPFSYWYHFGLEKYPGERHAKATLDFHRRLRTDVVKVMSDYPYPKSAGKWYELREQQDPFPEQIRALELIRDGLAGRAHFVETIFNPWNQATKISSKDAVLELKRQNPQRLLDTLEIIAKSEANHARRAVQAGASGIFLAIDNAHEGSLSREDYARFSEPFDKMILEAVKTAPLNILHIHGDRIYLDRFYRGWLAATINYSVHGSGISFEEARRHYTGVLMGGIDEVHFRKLTEDQMKAQWMTAQKAAGPKYILAPGCSVPNDTTDEELLRLTRAVGA
ncbi:MAG: hypothetical protein HUU41_13490 [Bryobacteraceae bacterium]|nr:hypothetical protein [Bryobacterales bacterium]MEB2360499.1 hypothetical protein [Bryobacterales bacterium]NUN02124.1 hypothetical protein [Bryobacteraceae bacterium]